MDPCDVFAQIPVAFFTDTGTIVRLLQILIQKLSNIF